MDPDIFGYEAPVRRSRRWVRRSLSVVAAGGSGRLHRGEAPLRSAIGFANWDAHIFSMRVMQPRKTKDETGRINPRALGPWLQQCRRLRSVSTGSVDLREVKGLIYPDVKTYYRYHYCDLFCPMEFNGDSEGTRLVPFFCLPCRVRLESRRLDGRGTRWKSRVDPQEHWTRGWSSVVLPQ